MLASFFIKIIIIHKGQMFLGGSKRSCNVMRTVARTLKLKNIRNF